MTTQDLVLLRKISRKRKLQLRGRITPHKVRFLAGRIDALGKRSKKPIQLNFWSTGGDYRPALDLYDAIKNSRAPVFGVVSMARSGALVALQACCLRVGRANSHYVAEPAWLKFPVRIDVYTKTEILSAMVGEHASRTILPYIREVWQRAHDILLERVLVVGKSEEDLHRLLDARTRMLTADEAREWGFIDAVLGGSRK